ncbi:MAG: TetR/AcrR family transcriptional regulator [Solirubrobacteraceae bacterium]
MSSAKPLNRREQAAEETRRLIIDAARHLFATRGYGATSIVQIAAEAGVAVPTIYASVGTKLRLLELLNDRIDEDAEVATLVPRLLSCREPVQILRLQIRLSRQLNERAGDLIAALRSAASVEPRMAGSYHTGMQHHYDGMRATAERLTAVGALSQVTTREATAILSALLAPDAWTSLVQANRLSWDQAEQLLNRVLARLLLTEP